MVAQLLIALIRVYQLTLSKLIRLTLGNVCRFEPSCSAYAAACLAGHGALRGSLLSVKRLCRCHPFHPGGYDPPPPPRKATRGHANNANNAIEDISARPAIPADPPGGAGPVPSLNERAGTSAEQGRVP